MIFWKWSDGTKSERTTIDKEKNKMMQMEKESSDNIQNAHSVSLNHDENTWDMLNNNFQANTVKNNREELNFKVSDRQMMQQIGNNPFLSNTNYEEDIHTHNEFLRPVNPKE